MFRDRIKTGWGSTRLNGASYATVQLFTTMPIIMFNILLEDVGWTVLNPQYLFHDLFSLIF